MKLKTLTLVYILISCLSLGGCQIEKMGDEVTESPVLQLLRYVPDTPDETYSMHYGDLRAWQTGRGEVQTERIQLDRTQIDYWVTMFMLQASVPTGLNNRGLFMPDDKQYERLGFNILSTNRFIVTGRPPNEFVVADISTNHNAIADSLTAFGYQIIPTESEGTLYGIHQDHHFDTEFWITTHQIYNGAFGDLNRIALLNEQILTTRSTQQITRALAAKADHLPSVADNPTYVAAVQAFESPEVAELGPLVGVIFESGENFTNLKTYPGFNTTGREDWLEELPHYLEQLYGTEAPLPNFSLIALSTRQQADVSYLVLTVVFPSGVDTESLTNILADRAINAVSVRREIFFKDYWLFEAVHSSEYAGLPVSTIVMRVEHGPTPEGDMLRLIEDPPLTWRMMHQSGDLLFLAPESLTHKTSLSTTYKIGSP